MLSLIPDWMFLAGGITALDPVRRTLYTYMQPAGQLQAPFHLVEINLDTFQVTLSPQAGDERCRQCAISLEWFPHD